MNGLYSVNLFNAAFSSTLEEYSFHMAQPVSVPLEKIDYFRPLTADVMEYQNYDPVVTGRHVYLWNFVRFGECFH